MAYEIHRRHELIALAQPRLCVCGAPAVDHGKCEACLQRYWDARLEESRGEYDEPDEAA